MSGRTVIEAEDVWKQYRLGVVNHATLQQDLQSWWARWRGHADPNSRLNQAAADPTRYGERFWALQDISFSVREGEVLGIIGRNGAGKSTLLKILARVTTPSRGVVRMRGRVASLLEVGTGFHPELTGRENVFLNGAILGMSRAEVRSRFDEIVSFAEVDRFIDTPVKRYSSGMYVRLAFAVAAHLEPEILIVDEVLAVGDAAFQRKCLGKMEAIGRTGRTVLFVSHQMAMVQRLCESCLLIEGGRLAAHGRSSEIVQCYLAGSGAEMGEGRRHGNGQLRFTTVRLVDAQGTARRQFFMGETVVVAFALEFAEAIGTPELSIEIKDRLGNSLAHISSQDGELTVRGKAGDVQEVTVTIPNLLLAPGHYVLTLWAGLLDETYDCLADCLELDLLQGEMIRRPGGYPGHVRCYLPARWDATGHE